MNPRLYTLLFALLLGFFSNAQSLETAENKEAAIPTESDVATRKATEVLVAKYHLNADQAKQMFRVVQRKARNMNEIAAFQTTDVALYHLKWSNVQKGTWASIRRILNTKEQVDIYQKTQSDIRGLRNAKRKELIAQKLSNEAVEAAVLAIYAE